MDIAEANPRWRRLNPAHALYWYERLGAVTGMVFSPAGGLTTEKPLDNGVYQMMEKAQPGRKA